MDTTYRLIGLRIQPGTKPAPRRIVGGARGPVTVWALRPEVVHGLEFTAEQVTDGLRNEWAELWCYPDDCECESLACTDECPRLAPLVPSDRRWLWDRRRGWSERRDVPDPTPPPAIAEKLTLF